VRLKDRRGKGGKEGKKGGKGTELEAPRVSGGVCEGDDESEEMAVIEDGVSLRSSSSSSSNDVTAPVTPHNGAYLKGARNAKKKIKTHNGNSTP